MRIDEFSAPSDIDGALDSTEITRFLLVGFDLSTFDLDWSEVLPLKSYISTSLSVSSPVTTKITLLSTVLENGGTEKIYD